jgi:hypothetical protein
LAGLEQGHHTTGEGVEEHDADAKMDHEPELA